MAEEPLLMNFALGNDAILVQPKFKGGRWRERRGLKKPTAPTGVNADNVLERPSKRQRIGDSDGHASSIDYQKRIGLRHGVISSLFTYNPKIQSATDGTEQESTTLPSNAPLVDGIDTFTSLGLSPIIASHLLTKLDIKAPTAIQKTTISQLLSGDNDALIQAETGSGKTLAYLLPIVQRIVQISEQKPKNDKDTNYQIHRDSGLFAIILAPTRELSKQISVVLDSLLGCARWIVSGTVIGGEKRKSEKARLRKGLNILVATPGRLVDHLQHTEVLDVSNVRWLVLDEGDRLMELGFEDDIKKILDKLEQEKGNSGTIPDLPSKRTTVLCSATMKTNVHKLGEISLKDAIHIQAETDRQQISQEPTTTNDPIFSAPAQLQQSYIVAPAKQRLVTLYAILKRSFSRKGSVMKTMIFFTCADSVDFHYEVFARKLGQEDTSQLPDSSSELSTACHSSVLSSVNNPDIMLYKLYGNLTQQMRTATLQAFSRNPNPSILLCTDVASRGLDLPSIDLVIEYDPAFSAEEHLHRIGRTARAGRDGRAIVFLLPGPEELYIPTLKHGFKDKRVNGSSSEEILRKAFAPAIASQSKGTWEDSATAWQLEVERWLQSDNRIADLARKAYVSHVRAYSTHVLPERQMFNVKELHLGHLAKAFALRDQPSNMGRGSKDDGGKRDPGKHKGRNRERSRNLAGSNMNDTRNSTLDPKEAARQMRKALNAMNPASEFNIG